MKEKKKYIPPDRYTQLSLDDLLVEEEPYLCACCNQFFEKKRYHDVKACCDFGLPDIPGLKLTRKQMS